MSVQAKFEETNQRWFAALEALRALTAKTRLDVTTENVLQEAVQCFAWALDARSDEYAKGYRKGCDDTRAKAEAALRSAFNR